MGNMIADVDTVFEWVAEGDSVYSSCRLSIYWMTWDTAIVIAKNISDNPGKKIADITQKIVFLISHNYDLSSNKIMLIEHYLTDNSSEEDIYLQVLLTKNKAVRYEIKKSKLLELIGNKRK